MTKDMMLLIKAMDSWKWPMTLGAFTGVFYGLYTDQVTRPNATESVIMYLCINFMVILALSVVAIYMWKLLDLRKTNNAEVK